MEFYNEAMTSSVFGIQVKLISITLGIILATLVIRRYMADKVMNVLARLASKTEVAWDDEAIEALRSPLSMAILLFGVWSAVKILPLPEKPFHLHYAVNTAAHIALLFIVAWAALRLINILEKEVKKKGLDPEYWLDSHLVPVISIGLKAVLGIGIFVEMAQTLGYSVGALVASLGIGGIAVALAAKDTLANFFGSVMVMLDRPFRIGDWVQGEHFNGVVEEIGFRSTKIRTFEKTVMIIPNDKIVSMIVENMDRRKDAGLNIRRVNFTLGLEYKASAAQVERAVNALRNLLKSHEMISEEGRQVYFSDFGESSLTILVNYYIKTTDFPEYMDVKQNVNLSIMRTLEEMGLSIALPTRSLYIEKNDA